MVSRRGHRIDLLDQDGRTEGITLSTTGDDKLQLIMDTTGTTITVHSDGTVLIEGKRASRSTPPAPSSSSRAARSR